MTLVGLFWRVTRVALLCWLAGLMALLPGGSAACWPLPNGQHLHLGWVDAHGHGSAHLHIVVHAERFFADIGGDVPSIGLARVGGDAPPLPMLPAGHWQVMLWAVTVLWPGPGQPALGGPAWQARPPTPPPRQHALLHPHS